MHIQQSGKSNFILGIIIGAVVICRVCTHFIEHASAFVPLTPMYAFALFSAAYLRGYARALIVTLGGLFISDVILCFTVYAPFRVGLLYGGWYWVYGSFALITLLAKWILYRVTITRFVTVVAVSSFIHWITASLSVCVDQHPEDKFLTTYFNLLVPAAAYELRLLAGTLFYGAVLFGGYALLRRRFSENLHFQNGIRLQR